MLMVIDPALVMHDDRLEVSQSGLLIKRKIESENVICTFYVCQVILIAHGTWFETICQQKSIDNHQHNDQANFCNNFHPSSWLSTQQNFDSSQNEFSAVHKALAGSIEFSSLIELNF